MHFNAENLLLLTALLVFISILISKTGYRFGIPTLLLFLFTGMFFGSDGLGLHFDSREAAQFIGMFSLSIILFTGGMDTKIRDIRPIAGVGVMLSTIGVVLTTAFTGGFVYLLSSLPGFNLHLSLVIALLLAATMSSTDSASVFNLLRSQGIGLKHNLRPILELESGSNDPMAYMLTIALMEIAIAPESFSWTHLLSNLGMQFIVGGIVGFLGGKASVWLINRIDLPNASLYPVLLLSICFIIFSVTDLLNGNGYLAVYIAGLMVGNERLSYRREMTTFMEGMTWLMQIIMFLTLGLLVNPSELFGVATASITIGLFMMLVARPLTVYLCLLPFRKIPIKAKFFLSWVGLRGAVPIIFATYPLIASVTQAEALFNIVFFITLLSLILQGMSISTTARWLHLDTPPEKTGNEFGIELPEHLPSKLVEIVLTEEYLNHVQSDKGNGKLPDESYKEEATNMSPPLVRLCDLTFPDGTLVMLIKRGGSIIVPNGKIELHVDDILLTITHHTNSYCDASQMDYSI